MYKLNYVISPSYRACVRLPVKCYNFLVKDNTPSKDNSVNEYIASLVNEQLIKDSNELLRIMQQISKHEPKLWNTGTVGFDTYHYKYDSGREGDAQILGFYPRKGRVTIYLMDGTARYFELLSKLGKHSITGYCIYIKQLSDIESSILEQILKASYEHIKSLGGTITQILWKMPVE